MKEERCEKEDYMGDPEVAMQVLWCAQQGPEEQWCGPCLRTALRESRGEAERLREALEKFARDGCRSRLGKHCNCYVCLSRRTLACSESKPTTPKKDDR